MIDDEKAGGEEKVEEASAEPHEDDREELDNLSSLSTSGPLNSSARVAILAALLAFKSTTFTELELALHLPKSSLNLSLNMLKQEKLVTVRRALVQIGGPRTKVEITQEGEKAIRNHLLMMQDLAKKLLQS